MTNGAGYADEEPIFSDESIHKRSRVDVQSESPSSVPRTKPDAPDVSHETFVNEPDVSTGDTSLTELAGIPIPEDDEPMMQLTGADLIEFARRYNVTVDAIDTLPAVKRAEAQQFIPWCILKRKGYSGGFEESLSDPQVMVLAMQLAKDMQEQGFLGTEI